ncbi:hypothetical protein T4D_1570 [Trichinella pseudospiralis]|uniref:Uncharacterized protein n=1 Tax=Trichinella pseudospiralis TaxID=6337 RepID=A0A0V1G6I1_TRIPS|nr:hypothetical protein T4D_1570 [Trichinella pseudospiralis]
MLCLIFLLSIVSATAFQELPTSQLMMVDYVLSCRAHCVDAFAPKSDHLNDSSCYHQNDCLSCWKYCETFYQKHLIMDSICKDSRICFTGCQMACYVYSDEFQRRGNQEMIWMSAAPLKIHRLAGMNKLIIEWQSPVLLLPTSSSVRNIVYALFWKKADQKIWVLLNHTINNSITINNSGFSSYIAFLLLAYTRDGEISSSLFMKKSFQKTHELNNLATSETYYCSSVKEMSFIDPCIIIMSEVIIVEVVMALVFLWKKTSIIIFYLSSRRNLNSKRHLRMSNEGKVESISKELFVIA